MAAAGRGAEERFWEFFGATLRNRNTRCAYLHAVGAFCVAMEARGLQTLGNICPLHVAANVDLLTTSHAAPTVKRHLAGARMLFDWLVLGQVLPSNPAAFGAEAAAWRAPRSDVRPRARRPAGGETLPAGPR